MCSVVCLSTISYVLILAIHLKIKSHVSLQRGATDSAYVIPIYEAKTFESF